VKVFVLGHRGMLGHVVARYLGQQRHEVLTSELRYTGSPRDPLVETVRASGCVWVVNAIGKIHQKSPAPQELFLANARLPVHLRSRLAPHQRLLHASTDCVFSGRRGSYRVDDERDAEDLYGFSKILAEAAAEPERSIMLRSSIIGPESGTAYGLMAWFLCQRQPVEGYRNHRWNGITSLEWAKLCAALIAERLPAAPLLQAAAAEAVSKYELLRLIASRWPGCAEVRPVDAPQSIDRTLVPQLERAPLGEQLDELKSW
jgi:dTDP-4-dehydrorhamnose reductase